MNYLILVTKIYLTVWVLFFVSILAFSWIPNNKGVAKIWDKLFTITLAVLLYAGALLLLLAMFLKIWGLIWVSQNINY